MKTFIPVLSLILAALSTPAVQAATPDAPEGCWVAESGWTVANGEFIFSFDGDVISASETARFIGDAINSGLQVIDTHVFDTHIGIVLKGGNPESTAAERRLINKAVTDLREKTPGIKWVSCNGIATPFPSTRTGT